MEIKTYFSVTGIITNNNKVLILKRADHNIEFPGYWSFCSGYVKEFEAAEDTIAREIKEETGLAPKISKKFGPIKVSHKDKEWIILLFLCQTDRTDVTLDKENVDYAWIDIKDIDKYALVPGIKKALKTVRLLE